MLIVVGVVFVWEVVEEGMVEVDVVIMVVVVLGAVVFGMI